MSAEQELLPDYVRRVMSEKGLNYREVARRSGGLISHTTVFDVVNQRTKDIKTETLVALAKGLGVPEEEIFAVARGKTLSVPEVFDSEIYVMFKGFEELSDEDKAELLGTIRMLAAEVQRRRPKGGKKK